VFNFQKKFKTSNRFARSLYPFRAKPRLNRLRIERGKGKKTEVGGRKSEGGGHPGEIGKKKAFHWVKRSEDG